MAELSKLGRYELRRVLGTGAMGVVYEGFDPMLSRRVAVKTVLKSVALDPETERAYSARFIQEAKAVARLNHPNIVQVHDFGVEGEVAYLVMEFVEGRELRSFFEAHEKFSPTEAVRIMGELLDALDFAHGKGVIHRDVKPANVMLDAQRRAKLADFGVARIQDSDRSMGGTMVGTPAFMSPEQIQGRKVDRRTDIFSAGVILYQLLTGEQPFKGEGAWTVAKRIVEDDPPPPSSIVLNVSSAFDTIVNKALAKNPAERFANAKDFAAALRGAQSAGVHSPVALQAPVKPKGAAAKATEAEVEFWRAIQNSSDPAEFEFYLEQFPEGTYAQLARHKIAKLREPVEAARKMQEEKARQEAEARALREAKERAKREAEDKARREAEEKARREVEEKAQREAAESARREAEAKARRVAAEQAMREPAAKAKLEAELRSKAKQEEETRAKREAEEKVRQAQVLARLKQQEQAGARGKVAIDADATVVIGNSKQGAQPSEESAATKKLPTVPVIVAVVVIVGGIVAYLILGRTPAPVPVAEAPSVQIAPKLPATTAADTDKIRREAEERVRREFEQKAVTERAALEKAVAEKAAAEKAAADKIALARTAADKAAEKAAAERIATEKAAAEKAASAKANLERAAQEKIAAEKTAATKVAADQAAANKLAAEKVAAEKAAALARKPGWPEVGDRWVYEVRDANRPEKRLEAVVEVKAVTSSVIRDVFKVSGSPEIASLHKQGAYMFGVPPMVIDFSPYLQAFQELRVGERWSDINFWNLSNCSGLQSICTVNAQVAGKERVSVRAGTFDAWKIVVEVHIRGTGTPGSVLCAYWYAEEPRRFVKAQTRVNQPYFTYPSIDMELVSYTRAGRR